MEGLGYKVNQRGFLGLAQRAPWAVLVGLSKNLPDSEMLPGVTAWLSAVSGLAPGSSLPGSSLPGSAPGSPRPERLPKGLGPPLSRGDWRLSGLRPANHPLRRMAGAAGLVLRFGETGLTVGLAEACEAGKPGNLTEALTVAPGDGGPACVGRGRARDLAVNVALAFLHALGHGAMGQAGETSPYLEIYRKFGKLQENDLTKEMSRRLLNPAWRGVVNSARRQQGLIQLHRLLTGAG